MHSPSGHIKSAAGFFDNHTNAARMRALAGRSGGRSPHSPKGESRTFTVTSGEPRDNSKLSLGRAPVKTCKNCKIFRWFSLPDKEALKKLKALAFLSQ